MLETVVLYALSFKHFRKVTLQGTVRAPFLFSSPKSVSRVDVLPLRFIMPFLSGLQSLFWVPTHLILFGSGRHTIFITHFLPVRLREHCGRSPLEIGAKTSTKRFGFARLSSEIQW